MKLSSTEVVFFVMVFIAIFSINYFLVGNPIGVSSLRAILTVVVILIMNLTMKKVVRL